MDTKKFLQGLCTNDINKLSEKENCMPASLLTNKGRIFANTILYYISKDSDSSPRVILELHKDSCSEVQRYLTMYRLRSKVAIKPLPWSCNFIPGSTVSNTNNAAEIISFVDPRMVGFGTRVLQPQGN